MFVIVASVVEVAGMFYVLVVTITLSSFKWAFRKEKATVDYLRSTA